VPVDRAVAALHTISGPCCLGGDGVACSRCHGDATTLHAVSNLAMAWTSPILGDFDGALRQASVSLEQFRGQDEPFWTALAVGSAGALETVVGRYDDALGHLRTARDLGERFATPGWPPGPRCSRASWPWCGAGWRKPGRTWMRRLRG
jgi:hypothetical protein